MDPRARQMLAIFGSPRNEPHAIKTYQPGLGADPQISVERLSDCLGSSSEESVLDAPGGVRILSYLSTGIERARGDRKNKEANPGSQAPRTKLTHQRRDNVGPRNRY